MEGVPSSICQHSLAHKKLTLWLGKKLQLPKDQIRMLQYASVAHDIGGGLKEIYKEEQENLLKLEFEAGRGKEYGYKPSFNPKLCFQHAMDRIEKKKRGPLTKEEEEFPVFLYLEEFKELKGKDLTLKEKELLTTWWYHPLYSIQLLEKKNLVCPLEVEILIRCNEQPWLLDTDRRMQFCMKQSIISKEKIKLLLAIMRAADIIENGNNFYRRTLRGELVEHTQKTYDFLIHKLKLDGLENYLYVADFFLAGIKEANEELQNILVESRNGEITIGRDMETGGLESLITREYLRIKKQGKVMSYGYHKENEHEILHNGAWYQFSFVPERKGEFDKLMKLSEALPEPFSELEIQHQNPKNRKCPFCHIALDELLFRMKMPSQKQYAILANIDPYGEEHIIMCGKKGQEQSLTLEGIFELLEAARIFGSNYEGSFTSFGGASIKHWHGQFYRTKTPVWKNLKESRLEISRIKMFDGVLCGELSGWPARTLIFKGMDQKKVAKQVWNMTYQLMKKNVPYNTKFLYDKNEGYIWLLSPRKHGFMTFAEYFLKDEKEQRPEYVSGCGSIESPGGDVIMFFDVPKDFTGEKEQDKQKKEERLHLMAERFAITLRETSDWQVGNLHRKDTFHKTIFHTKGQEYWIAHRMESVEQGIKALDKGVDMLEVDVQMTKDNILVAFWGKVKKSDGTQTCIYRLTFEELTNILGYAPMKLEELVKKVKNRAGFNFDIKDWSDSEKGYKDELAKELVDFICKHNLQNDVLIDSFNSQYMDTIRMFSQSKGLELLFGLACFMEMKEQEILNRITYASENGYVTVFIYKEQLTEAIVKKANQSGIDIITQLNDKNNQKVRFYVV